jgi:hypothetical protein
MFLRLISLAALITVSCAGVFSTAQASPKPKTPSDPRSSEAKSTLGTLVRTQQAFWLEHKNHFATDINQLDAIINGKFYDYKVVKTEPQSVVMQATPKIKGLKPYIAGAAYQKNSDNYSYITCEGQQTGKVIAYPTFDGKALKCGKGTTLVVE